ncbi:hypothetical protein D3C73_1133240 [compost metagenome]
MNILPAATTIDYSTMFGGIVDEAVSGVQTAAPLGLKIGGMVLAIGIVWKIVKRFAK